VRCGELRETRGRVRPVVRQLRPVRAPGCCHLGRHSGLLELSGGRGGHQDSLPERGFCRCRRRDSNPRHADYDAEVIPRSSGVYLGLAEVESQITLPGFGLFRPDGVCLVAILLPVRRRASSPGRRSGTAPTGRYHLRVKDLTEKSFTFSGVAFPLPYSFRVNAITNNPTPTVSVITDVNFLAELLLAKLAPLVSSSRPDDTAEGYWTVAEASSYMSCDKQRIYDLNSQGRLRCVKDGKRLLTCRVWIDTYLEGGS